MNSVQETIKSFTPDQRKLIQRAGLSEKEMAKALTAMRENTTAAFFTKANERYAICQNTVIYQREQRNKMLANRKTLKKAVKKLKEATQRSGMSDADRTEAQRALEEGEMCVRKADRALAEMDENIERLQAEMEKERAGAVDTIKDIDCTMAMGLCMLHAIDIFFDNFSDLMQAVGYASTSVPDLYHRFSDLFGEYQRELIRTKFYIMERGKLVWGYDAQTKLHIALADRADDFHQVFAEFCAKTLKSLNNGK